MGGREAEREGVGRETGRKRENEEDRKRKRKVKPALVQADA